MASTWTATKTSFVTLLIVALFCCTILADEYTIDDENSPPQADVDARRFLTKRSVRVCGIKLVDMMKKVCNHCYKTRKQEQRPHEVAKRNAAQSGFKAIVAILNEGEENENRSTVDNHNEDGQRSSVRRSLDTLDTYIDKRWNGDIRRPRQQAGGGIANKCCINQCSYSDLVSYCCTSASP